MHPTPAPGTEPTRIAAQPRPSGTVTLLRYWLLGSAVALVAFFTWIIAPVLFLVLALTASLGVLSAVIVMLARRLERWKHAGTPPAEDA